MIKKKFGKWRLIQDCQKLNEIIQKMGVLQPGLPFPIAITKDTYKIILYLKDYFDNIPLAPQDCHRFAFSIPSVNSKKSMRRYHWRVLQKVMTVAKICGSSYTEQENNFYKFLLSIKWIPCLSIKIMEFYLQHTEPCPCRVNN